MAKRRSNNKGGRAADDRPKEIPMTDLGWPEDGEPRLDVPSHGGDSHAAGTPGGGTATGGLAGTNVGDGDPDNVDLEDAHGSGIHDTSGEEADQPPYSGPAGGAVGGTPADGRARGGLHAHGNEPGGIRPEGVHRGDSTIGSPRPKRRRRSKEK